MAKTSKIESWKRRKEVVARYREKRRELRKTMNNINISWDERMEARRKLENLPRYSMEVRLNNRCRVTGRPRGYLRKFEMSRLTFRDTASNGLLPGVTKASW